MIEEIPTWLFMTATPWAITATTLFVLVRLIYTGKLVPASTVSIYVTALETERQASAELRAALADYQQMGHTTVSVLESIQSQERSNRDAKPS